MKISEISLILLSVKSARDFLTKYIEVKKTVRKSYGYAELARASRIKSRSFVRDLITGRRMITLEVSKKISAGLKLSSDQSKYLESLVVLEKAQKTEDLVLLAEVEARLGPLRRKISARNKKVTQFNSRHKTFGIKDWPYIYSSLVDEKTGVSLAAVSKKSRISIEKCKMILDQLVEIQVAHRQVDGDQLLYFPTSSILSFDKLADENSFQSSFIKSSLQLAKSAEKTFSQNEDRLFLDAIFSIESSQLPAFRAAIQRRVLETVQEFENSQGDDIVTFVCGFFRRSDIDKKE